MSPEACPNCGGPIITHDAGPTWTTYACDDCSRTTREDHP